MQKRVLIIDDEPGILSTLSGILGDEGYETLTTGSGEEALAIYRDSQPEVVFLDIWLPDMDGLETLGAILEIDPGAAVVMMSGHAATSTAVKAIKMGALDYMEKPLSYGQAVEGAAAALEYRESMSSSFGALREPGRRRRPEIVPPPSLPQLAVSERPQKTIRENIVIYGLGLHSGTRTGMAIQPLPPDSGIHFQTMPNNRVIPAHVGMVADTDYATTLSSGGDEIRTVEHFLSALHALGVTNLLIKVHGEIPVLDGSALEFCNTLEEIGVSEQEAARREVVVDRRYEVGGGNGKLLTLEPYDGFKVSYRLKYPPPVGEQAFGFELTDFESYKRDVAPARTFGFMRDLAMMNELGLGSGGRLDNCILVGEDDVINTELRFPDEFARHKVLDVIGDLYLLGYPIRGQVEARFTGHRDNIEILRRLAAGAAD